MLPLLVVEPIFTTFELIMIYAGVMQMFCQGSLIQAALLQGLQLVTIL